MQWSKRWKASQGSNGRDFEIFEDGRKQEITSFTYVPIVGTQRLPQRARTGIKLPPLPQPHCACKRPRRVSRARGG
jgi:hypothetical protein